MILEMQARLDEAHLTVDPKHFKHIIGKNGVNINRIRSETGVVINIEVDGSSNVIRIEGSKEGVEEAQKVIVLKTILMC